MKTISLAKIVGAECAGEAITIIEAGWPFEFDQPPWKCNLPDFPTMADFLKLRWELGKEPNKKEREAFEGAYNKTVSIAENRLREAGREDSIRTKEDGEFFFCQCNLEGYTVGEDEIPEDWRCPWCARDLTGYGA